MRWFASYRADELALPIADRHYNRQHVGSPQFVPPGRCLVLLTERPDALWVTSWPLAQYTHHDWPGAWVCSCFRNEGQYLSSDLIREAVAATRSKWKPPLEGMITFVDSSKVRRKRDPGRCFIRAGFKICGITKGGLIALHLDICDMPAPLSPLVRQPVTLDNLIPPSDKSPLVFKR